LRTEASRSDLTTITCLPLPAINEYVRRLSKKKFNYDEKQFNKIYKRNIIIHEK
jgi:hypothetical protein